MRFILQLSLNIIFTVGVIAQTTGKISGTIKDGDTNEPLIAANVIVKDTNLGTASDLEGYYSIVNINSRFFHEKQHL